MFQNEMIQLVYRLDQRTIHADGKSFNPCPAEPEFILMKTLQCLTLLRDCGVRASPEALHCVLNLVLVQPRKTRPNMTEKLLTEI